MKPFLSKLFVLLFVCFFLEPGGLESTDDVSDREGPELPWSRAPGVVAETDKVTEDIAETDDVMPDVAATDEVIPDVAEADEVMPDVAETEQVIPDVAETDQAIPDVAETDKVIPDVAETDQAIPDVAETDKVIPDVAETDQAIPDVAEIDKVIPDVAETDQAIPDVAETDKVIPDVAETDQAIPDVAEIDKVIPDVAETDKVLPDVAVADKVIPDVAETDKVIPDVAETDEVMPDAAEIEKVIPDVAETDEVMPDAAEIEKVIPDVAETDEVMPDAAEIEKVIPDVAETHETMSGNFEETEKATSGNFEETEKAMLENFEEADEAMPVDFEEILESMAGNFEEILESMAVDFKEIFESMAGDFEEADEVTPEDKETTDKLPPAEDDATDDPGPGGVEGKDDPMPNDVEEKDDEPMPDDVEGKDDHMPNDVEEKDDEPMPDDIEEKDDEPMPDDIEEKDDEPMPDDIEEKDDEPMPDDIEEKDDEPMPDDIEEKDDEPMPDDTEEKEDPMPVTAPALTPSNRLPLPGHGSANLYSPFPAYHSRGTWGSGAWEVIEETLCGNPRNDCYSNCKICFDDVLCHMYGDCCSPNDHLKIAHGNLRQVTCMKIKSFGRPLFMVTSCPHGYNDTDINRKCSQPRDMEYEEQLPVSYGEHVVYRNVFCARCHGVSGVVPWQLYISVDMNVLARDLAHNSTGFDPYRALLQLRSLGDLYRAAADKPYANISVSPEGTIVRECTPPQEIEISQCNVTGLWPYYDRRTELACSNFQGRPSLRYQNIFCRLCNTDVEWRDLISTCDIAFPDFVSLAAILDLEAAESVYGASPDRDCDVNSVLDPAQCTCRPMVCSVLQTIREGHCEKIVSKSSSFGFAVHLEVTAPLLHGEFGWMDDSINPPTEKIDDLRSDVERILIKSARSYDNLMLHSYQQYATVINCEEEMVFVSFEVIMMLGFAAPVALDKVSQHLLDIFTDEKRIYNDVDKLLKRVSGPGADDPFSFRDDCPVGLVDAIRGLVSSQKVYVDFTNSNKDFFYLKLDYLMTCEQVELEPDEFQLSKDRRTLTVLAARAALPVSKFRLVGDKARVCLDHYLAFFADPNCSVSGLSLGVPGTDDREAPGVAGLLSLICSTVSLVFLLLTLAVYALLGKLKTISGFCSAGMVGVLFLAQAVFEFGAEQTETAELCVALGVLAHYLWLSATFWMNACTVLMFYRLVYPLAARVRLASRSRVLALTSLYALLSPALVVASSMAANFGLHGDLGYGGAICYIKRATTRQLALALPVAVLVGLNVVLCLWTIARLRRSSRLLSSAENKISLLGSVRLSAVTGLSWAFLFLHEAVSSRIAEYAAIVLFGLHGVVVFLSLVVNPSVLGTFRSRLTGGSTDQNTPARGQNDVQLSQEVSVRG